MIFSLLASMGTTPLTNHLHSPLTETTNEPASSVFDSMSSSVIKLSGGRALYLKEINRHLALICILREEALTKQALIDYNVRQLKKSITKLFRLNQQLSRPPTSSSSSTNLLQWVKQMEKIQEEIRVTSCCIIAHPISLSFALRPHQRFRNPCLLLPSPLSSSVAIQNPLYFFDLRQHSSCSCTLLYIYTYTYISLNSLLDDDVTLSISLAPVFFLPPSLTLSLFLFLPLSLSLRIGTNSELSVRFSLSFVCINSFARLCAASVLLLFLLLLLSSRIQTFALVLCARVRAFR